MNDKRIVFYKDCKAIYPYPTRKETIQSMIELQNEKLLLFQEITDSAYDRQTYVVLTTWKRNFVVRRYYHHDFDNTITNSGGSYRTSLYEAIRVFEKYLEE